MDWFRSVIIVELFVVIVMGGVLLYFEREVETRGMHLPCVAYEDYDHLFTVVAGMVHRQKALIEQLNLKGVLTAEEARETMQMRVGKEYVR